MRINLKVILVDETEIETTATIADFVAWERHSKKVASDLSNGAGIEDMAFLAWSSLKRAKKTALAFNEWLETVDELEAADVEDPKATQKEA